MNDVEEGESTVAILLRNRDHETKVAAREIALGLFVLAEHAQDVAHAALVLVHWLEHEIAESIELLLHDIDIFWVVAVRMLLSLAEIALHFAHLRKDAEEFAIERNDATSTQAALFEQRADASATQRDFALQTSAHSGADAACFDLLPRGLICLQQALNRREIRRDALLDLLLRVWLSSRDAHGAIERKFLRVHILQDLHGFARCVIALEHLATEDHARGFDLLGKTDFLFAREQRNRAHLREVHANRIVNALRALLSERLLDGRLHFGVVEDVLFNIEVVRVRTFILALRFAFSGLLFALGLLDLEFGRSECRGRRMRRTRVTIARDFLWLIARELQVRLQWRRKGRVVVAADLHLIHHLDGVLAHEHQQLIDPFRIDELVRQASVELFVANPAALNALFDERAKDWAGEIE